MRRQINFFVYCFFYRISPCIRGTYSFYWTPHQCNTPYALFITNKLGIFTNVQSGWKKQEDFMLTLLQVFKYSTLRCLFFKSNQLERNLMVNSHICVGKNLKFTTAILPWIRVLTQFCSWFFLCLHNNLCEITQTSNIGFKISRFYCALLTQEADIHYIQLDRRCAITQEEI